MKYAFSSTEQEVTALYNLIGQIVQEVGRTVRHSNELRARRSPLSGPGTMSEPTEVDADSDGDVIDFKQAAARRTEKEVEDEPKPPPAAARKAEEAAPPTKSKDQKRLEKGRKAFDEFIQNWLEGINRETMFPVEGVTQPNRDQMLRDLQNGRYGYAVILFVKSVGGLQCAIADVTGSQDLALALAPYIVPPASIAFNDLADTYEYTNPFKKDED